MLADVSNVSLSASVLKNIMIEESVYTIIIEREEIKGISLGLKCDKGESEKRNGASFVKLVPRFDAKKNKVKVTCIGIHSAGSFNVDAAEGVDYALKLYDRDRESA